MKNINILSFTILAFSLVFSSCSDNDADSDLNPTSSSGDYFFTCEINGVAFAATHDAASVSIGADMTEYFNIQGRDAADNKVTLTLQSPTQTGTFETGDPGTPTQTVAAHYAGKSPVGSTVGNWSTRDDNGKGTITITESTSSNMKGTFSFYASGGSFTPSGDLDTSTLTFTNGKFNARRF